MNETQSNSNGVSIIWVIILLLIAIGGTYFATSIILVKKVATKIQTASNDDLKNSPDVLISSMYNYMIKGYNEGWFYGYDTGFNDCTQSKPYSENNWDTTNNVINPAGL